MELIVRLIFLILTKNFINFILIDLNFDFL